MLGDLDLIHSAAARDRVQPQLAATPPATAEPSAAARPNHLSRFSYDSGPGSATSGSLGSSLGSFATSPKGSFLMRQFSTGPSSPSGFGSVAGTSAPVNTAPIAIPRRSGAAAGGPVSPTGAGAAANNTTEGSAAAGFLRRHSMVAAYSTTTTSAAAGAGTTGAAASAAAPVGVPSSAAAHHRMPALVRSLSKGLSQSLDFR